MTALTAAQAPDFALAVFGFMTLLWFTLPAIDRTRAQVRDWRHRRDVRRQNALHECYGGVYRIGSPPSHASRYMLSPDRCG